MEKQQIANELITIEMPLSFCGVTVLQKTETKLSFIVAICKAKYPQLATK